MPSRYLFPRLLPPHQYYPSSSSISSSSSSISSSSSSSMVSIKATVVLIKSSVLDIKDLGFSLLDHLKQTLGQGVTFHLVSSSVAGEDGKGKLGKGAHLEGWNSDLFRLKAEDLRLEATFEWDTAWGTPGAVVVRNNHHSEFYLKSVTLEDVPAEANCGGERKKKIQFVCHSWVYPTEYYNYDRVFFVNDTLTDEQTPEPLRKYRREELFHLRGDDVGNRRLEKWDRVYAYDYYNDLGDPDQGPDFARPILGGSEEYPYPRRVRTGRPATKSDPNTESRLPLLKGFDIYVPRDEAFTSVKLSDFLGGTIKVLAEALPPTLNTLVDESPFEFDSIEDTMRLYEGGPEVDDKALAKLRKLTPFQILKELFRSDGQNFLQLPLPEVIRASKTAWRTDEEFGREMLAGTNPVVISRLTVFPPASKLDPSKYGDHTSRMTAADVEKNMGGLTVEQALRENKLFILDHHDAFITYLNRVNSTASKVYASRTILLLKDDGTLKPLAIELSLPHPSGENHGVVSKVFTPAENGVEGSIWQLAKAYVGVDDSGSHQLISHWLHTHATIEPFAIATHRQLSVMHPIYKLLHPHYRDTLYINALARQVLIHAGGILENTVFPSKYSMELSSMVYKGWNFTEQGLPSDLLKRGVAVEDAGCPGKINLLIKDYPYAVDGLAVWSAINHWVVEYCSIYYPDDAAIQKDGELQAWWKEIREIGHGDKKNEPWWSNMQSISDLTEACTTIIWVASALHAAVNFGQYSYAGFLPNRPTLSRRFMPEPGTPEYLELETNPDLAFIKTITAQLQTIIGVSLIELLSKHSMDEVYLGQRESVEWTSDENAILAFKKFGEELMEIEQKITEMNKDPSLRNRNGPVKLPYTSLYPDTSNRMGSGGLGLTGKGIPNSVSI